MRVGRVCSVIIVAALVVVVYGAGNNAAARKGKRHRSGGPAVPRSDAGVPTPDTNAAVRCSCTSTSSCPQIGTLSVPGHSSEPLYCNQLNGAENPGVRSRQAWYFQCVELANRWLVNGVGGPRIDGHAKDLCLNADRASYDVHNRGTAHEPVPGDLLVWDGYAYGHVGVVTAVSSDSIAFANQNYGQHGVQYPLLTAARTAGFFGSPRNDNGWSAKCIIHPKKLAGKADPSRAPRLSASPCDGVSPANDGRYCGASRQNGFGGGDARTLYTCNRGIVTSTRCTGNCTIEPSGRDDHCM